MDRTLAVDAEIIQHHRKAVLPKVRLRTAFCRH